VSLKGQSCCSHFRHRHLRWWEEDRGHGSPPAQHTFSTTPSAYHQPHGKLPNAPLSFGVHARANAHGLKLHRARWTSIDTHCCCCCLGCALASWLHFWPWICVCLGYVFALDTCLPWIHVGVGYPALRGGRPRPPAAARWCWIRFGAGLALVEATGPGL
jgi:hypothetical protein